MDSFTSFNQSLLGSSKTEQPYLDWAFRIDLNKNMERTVQTRPVVVTEEDQSGYWAFVIDLGNNGMRSPKNAQSMKGPDGTFTQNQTWFKFSVLECCVNTSNSTSTTPVSGSNISMSKESLFCGNDGQRLRGIGAQNTSFDHIMAGSSAGYTSLSTKKAKFIKRKTSPTSLSRKSNNVSTQKKAAAVPTIEEGNQEEEKPLANVKT